MPKQTQKHIPVMQEEVLELLDPKKGESYLDITAGYGGHAAAVISLTKSPSEAVLVDQDEEAIRHLKENFKSSTIMHSDFVSALRKLQTSGRRFDLILADLGVSSPHLENSRRGFSIRQSGPLDMRMDQSRELDAAQIVNTYPEKRLTQILRDYGEEPKALQIARRIIDKRPLTSTTDLASIAASVWRGHSRVHPATRTFQAIRLAVNDELRQLAEALPIAAALLNPRGRLAVISFHSLEDRIVKEFLADESQGYEAELAALTKKPLLASEKETVSNPRARSAKLRAAAKIKTKIGRK